MMMRWNYKSCMNGSLTSTFAVDLLGTSLKNVPDIQGAIKEKLPYGASMKALSQAKKTRLNQGKDRWNRKFKQPNNGFTKSERHERSLSQQFAPNPYENEPESKAKMYIFSHIPSNDQIHLYIGK